MRLLSAVRYDLKLQFRHGFYAVYAIICAAYIAVIRVLPGEWRVTAVRVVVFMDPSVLGLFFIGGIILLEQGQNILEGLFITPLRLWEYILAKAVSLTLLALLSSLVIVVGSYGWRFNWLWLCWGVGLTSVIYVLIGFALITRAPTLNHYLVLSPLVIIVSIFPLVDLFGMGQSAVLFLIPTQASWLLISAAFNPAAPWKLIYALSYLTVWTGLAFYLAQRLFYRYAILRGGKTC